MSLLIQTILKGLLFLSPTWKHHSNHTSWLETIAKVVIIGKTEDNLVDLNDFKVKLEQYKSSTLKIASVIAGSNVTGIKKSSA